jgi:sodium transport system permease protein
VRRFLNQIGPVFHKEWLDAIRDRRSVTSALIFPLLAPLMINLMFGTIAGQERSAEDMVFHVQGAEHAPGLMEWIERANHEVVATEGDLFEAVRSGDLDLALLIESDYAEDFAKGIPATVSLIVNGSKNDLLPLNFRARNIIESYGAHTGTLRLVARGVSGDVRTPVQLKELDVATIEQRSATFLFFIPILIILAAFVSGMNVAIDTTAGERERGSLEPLLINPASRNAIVVGKWLVTVAFASAGIAMVLAATVISLQHTSLEDLGVRMDVGGLDYLVILVGVLPLAFLASGLQLLVSTFARSFKEAQTYVSLLTFLPTMVPFGIVALSGLPTDPWLAVVPALGQQMIVTQVLGGENPGVLMFVVSGVSSMLLGLLCVVLTSRLFRRERIVFGATS